jgi:hypothetical protein
MEWCLVVAFITIFWSIVKLHIALCYGILSTHFHNTAFTHVIDTFSFLFVLLLKFENSLYLYAFWIQVLHLSRMEDHNLLITFTSP